MGNVMDRSLGAWWILWDMKHASSYDGNLTIHIKTNSYHPPNVFDDVRFLDAFTDGMTR